MLVVGGVPRARPGGLHQAWARLRGSGPAPLRLVSMTKWAPSRSPESRVPNALTALFDWKFDTLSEKPSASPIPALRSGSVILAGSEIQAGLPASR